MIIAKNLKRGIAVMCSAALISAMAISVSASDNTETEVNEPLGKATIARVVEIADDEVTLEVSGGHGKGHIHFDFDGDKGEIRGEDHMNPPADIEDGTELPELPEMSDENLPELPDESELPELPENAEGMNPMARGNGHNGQMNDFNDNANADMEKNAPRMGDESKTPPELPENGKFDESTTPPEKPDRELPEDLPELTTGETVGENTERPEKPSDEEIGEEVEATTITVDIDLLADNEIEVGDIVKIVYDDADEIVSVEVLDDIEMPLAKDKVEAAA